MLSSGFVRRSRTCWTWQRQCGRTVSRQQTHRNSAHGIHAASSDVRVAKQPARVVQQFRNRQQSSSRQPNRSRGVAQGGVIAAALLLGAGCCNAIAEEEKTDTNSGDMTLSRFTISNVVDSVSATVVTVHPPGSVGSGVIFDDSGLVLTNQHVLHTHRPELIGEDEETDLAVLKLPSGSTYPSARLATNRLSVRTGEIVLAVGAFSGLYQSVSMGIVSAAMRDSRALTTFGEPLFIGTADKLPWIQTDVAVHHGNSGGPLFNLQGEVVGIIKAKSALSDGLTLAIPAWCASGVAQQLLTRKHVDRPVLGIVLDTPTADIQRKQHSRTPHQDWSPLGARVVSVAPGSPAHASGLKAGDFLVELDGQPIVDHRQVVLSLGFAPSKLRFTVRRPSEEALFTIETETMLPMASKQQAI